MAINLAHRPDLDRRVEQLADHLGLKGRGRKTAIIERALTLLEKHVVHDRPDRAVIEAALDRYIAKGSGIPFARAPSRTGWRRPATVAIPAASALR